MRWFPRSCDFFFFSLSLSLFFFFVVGFFFPDCAILRERIASSHSHVEQDAHILSNKFSIFSNKYESS